MSTASSTRANQTLRERLEDVLLTCASSDARDAAGLPKRTARPRAHQAARRPGQEHGGRKQRQDTWPARRPAGDRDPRGPRK
eukprot:6207372-Prymnesium_polylepis.1